MCTHAAGERWVAIYFAVLRAATLCIADVYSGQSAQLSAATEASTLTAAAAALVAEPDAAERASVDLAAGVTAQAASTYADGGEAAGSGASFLAFGPIGIGYAWGGIVWKAVKANRQGDGAFAGDVTVPVPAPRADNPYDHRHDLTLSRNSFSALVAAATRLSVGLQLSCSNHCALPALHGSGPGARVSQRTSNTPQHAQSCRVSGRAALACTQYGHSFCSLMRRSCIHVLHGSTYHAPGKVCAGKLSLWHVDATACRADPTITEMDPEEVQQNYAPHWGAVTPFGFTQLAGKITDLPPVPKTASLDYPGDFAATKLVGFPECDCGRAHRRRRPRPASSGALSERAMGPTLCRC